MKRAALLLAAGCSSTYDIRVEATPDRLSIDVYDDTCDCAEPPPVGHCDSLGEAAPSCNCHRVACITNVRLERGGAVVDQVAVEQEKSVFFQTMPAGTDVVVDGCGREARIPIPEILPTAPAINVWSGGHVEWTDGSPVDTVTLRLSNAERQTICTVGPGLGAYDIGSGFSIEVGAHLAATTVTTTIGEAHVQPSAYASMSTVGSAN